MATLTTAHRTFTKKQSSAIHSITIDGTDVVLVYHSNVDKAYAHKTNEAYAEQLANIITDDELVNSPQFSVGATINDAKRTGELELATV